MKTDKNYTASQIASEVGLDALTVGKIFASMKVTRGAKKYNVGLKLKSTSRGVANPEWAEKVHGVWHYSDKAKDTLRKYVELFPNIVKAIQDSRTPDFDGSFSNSELQACYKWASHFRAETYKRIDIQTGKDLTGIK